LCALLLPAVTLGSAGCGSGAVPTGEVSGMVTFEGKAVGEGLVTFQSDKGTGDEAAINGDGSYAIKKPLPVGDYKVMIMPPVVKMQVDGKGPTVGVLKKMPNMPEKYHTIGTTDLKATVNEGKNVINLDMKK